MAKGRYQELYEARMKRLGKNINKSESLQNQINNYKTKLAAGGADPTIDDRNAIEKLLNLDQDQGLIKDIFEILNRPQQAIFSGINAAQEGGSFLEGAAKGITGNDDETDFKKILMNTGEFEDEEGKFDLVDALGTAGDIFLDPMNIPVGGFSKVAKALDAGEGAFKALRNLDTVDDVLFKAAGKGIKKGAKIADTGIETGLKHLDATKGVRVYDKHGNKISDTGKLLYANQNASRASELMPDLQNKKEFGKSVVIPERGRLEKYKQMKDDVRSMFKKSDASINAIVAKRDANNTADAVRTQIGKMSKDKENIVKEYASDASNKTTLEQASEDIMLFAESHMDRTISKDDLLDIARDGELYANDNIIAAFDEMRNQVPQNVKFGLDLSVTVGDDGVIKLGSGWNKDVLSSAGIPSFNELDDSRKMVDYGNWYTDKDLKRIEKLRKDKKFREMFSKVVGEIKDGDKIVIDPLSNEIKILDGEGQLIATITNDLIDNANKVFDTGFGSKLGQKFTNNSVYVPHTLADETVLSSADEFGQGVDTIVKGKTSILNPRKRLGSVREINNLWKQSLTGSTATDATKAFYKKHPRLFEENFNKAFTNKYYNDMVELGKQNKIINSVLVEQTFGNITEIKKLQKEMISLTRAGKTEELAEVSKRYNELIENSTIKQLTKYDNTVPNGFTKITKEHAKDLKNKINKIKKVLGVDDKSYDNLVKLFDGKEGDIAINTDVLRMLEVPLDTKKTNEFVRMYDKWLKYFKTFKTLSPVNFLNNLVGNSSNLYLSGIDMLDQAKLMPKAVDIVKNGPELYNRKLIGEVLTPEQDEIAEYWKKFLETGFGSAESALELRDLQDLPDYMIDFITKGKANKKITAKDIALYLPKLNLKTGAFMDNVSRVTVMLKAVDDPSYLARLGIDGVNDAEKLRKVISKVMFDPSMLTDFERNVMRRVVPFYTYAKNNLVFQIDNLSKNANRYRKTLKGMENLQKAATGGNDENMEEYLKNNLYIPIPALDENGNYTMLRAQLPFGQLIEMTDDPIQQLVNMSGPASKGLYEFGTGIDSFTGRPIESFEGEKSAQLPFLTKKQQKLISDLTGLDVPLKNAYRLLTDPLSTVTMQRNIDTDKLARQYDEINELKTMMKQYQQEGYEFSTMNELKRANKNGVVGKYNSLFLKYGIE